MDYDRIFTPIFSLALHAAGPIRRSEMDMQTFLADLDVLVAKAFARRRASNPGHFDLAWFAVGAWLDETLPPSEYASFQPETAGEEFFDKLDVLLRSEEEKPDLDRLAVIEVFAACLALGFRGRYQVQGNPAQIESYRQRCREAIASARNGGGFRLVQATAELRDRQAPTFGKRLPVLRPAGSFLLWLLPVVLTSGLYVVCKHLLSQLYNDVMG